MSVPGLDDDRDSFIRGSCRSFDPQLCALILCAKSASQIVAQGNALGYRARNIRPERAQQTRAESALHIIAQGNALGYRDHGIFALKGHNKDEREIFRHTLQGGNLF